MRQKGDPPPPFISFYDVPPPAQSRAAHYYLEAKTPRGTGQVATRCHHPDCCPDGDSAGHLVSVDLVFALAELKAWRHSATHQPQGELTQ